ncbi:unnamed protein product [Urochloa humidicola]
MPTTFLLLPPLDLDGGKLLEAVVPVPCLPTDILLEIFARTDPATLVRCAATSKNNLRRVADPTFLRRYDHLLDSRFVPSLLLGLYCIFLGDDDQLVRIIVPPGPDLVATPYRPLAEDTMLTLSDWKYIPIAACGNLLFAKDLYASPGLMEGRVIDTSSSRPQRYVSILAADIDYTSLVLLPDDHDEDNNLISFRLVALKLFTVPRSCQTRICAQIYWSRLRKWDWVQGRPMEVSPPGGSPFTWHDSETAVLRTGVANWLCKSNFSYHIISLIFGIDDAHADVIDLPPGCQAPWRDIEEFLLAPSAERKLLSLLVADGLKINVWTRTAANSTVTRCWERHLVIDVLDVAGELSQRWPLPQQVDPKARVKFERWFGERSGTAVLRIDRCGHFALNLATKKLQLLKEFSKTGDMWLLCGQEINPIPLLRKLQLLNIT